MEGHRDLILLHGMGEDSSAWDAVRAELSPEIRAVAIDTLPAKMGAGPGGFTLSGAVESTRDRLDRAGTERADLCGLSLGAIVALQFALEDPSRVRTLTLAAGQVKPPRALMAVQRVVLKLVPAASLSKQGLEKESLLSVLREVSDVDFSDRLHEVTVPTLVLCGQRDRPNLPAARALAAGITGAELRIIPGAGHQSHVQQPEAFAQLQEAFLSEN